MLRFTFKNKKYRLNLHRFACFMLIVCMTLTALIITTKHVAASQSKPSNKPIDWNEVVNVTVNPIGKTLKEATIKVQKEIKKQEKTETTKIEEYIIMPIYSDTATKRYMDRKAITATNTLNYQLCNEQGVGCSDGTVEVDGRKLIALGQEYGTTGDKFDITLQKDDGTVHVVKCIIGDNKKYQDTQNGEGYVATDGTTMEIIVDTSNINQMSRTMGDMNYTPSVEGKIIEIKKLKN